MAVYEAAQYSQWTASCFDWPSDLQNPYYYCAVISFTSYLMTAWAIRKSYEGDGRSINNVLDRSFRLLLQGSFLVVLMFFCGGGLVLAAWMRNQLMAGVQGAANESTFAIIEVMLFVFSFVVVIFSLAVMLVAGLGQKAAESNELRKAKSIAEHANAAKSDFLASMSNEIRTPINAVLGMNEMILRESLQARDLLPPEREVIRSIFNNICTYSGNIESAGNNLLSIINDILDFSKIEAGKIELVPGPYKLSSVLNDVSNMILFRANNKGLAFQVDVDDTLPDNLYGDEVRVRQIITNILSNAVKYTDKGSVRLIVGRKEKAKDGLLPLEIAVADTGIGIREENRIRLFSKFERMDLAHNSTVEGTGLGLAITKSLVDLMGGSIQVESTYGKGSTFTLCIPQKVLSEEHVGNFREKFELSMKMAKARRESFRAPDAHILVVDDTRMNITVVESLLRDTRIKLDGVLSGEEAIDLCKRIRYDLILMDQRMPVMDGTEALHRIRAEGVNRDTPVICLTADAVTGAKERYLSLGFTDYLTKPVDSYSLEQKLLSLLPQEKIQHVLEQPAALPQETTDFSALTVGGIQSELGLQLCHKDKDLYLSVITEFCRGSEARQRALQTALDSRDWLQYGIHVHALKSSAKLLGAVDLSELAGMLEKEADSGQGAEILSGHPRLIDLYNKAVEAASSFVTDDYDADEDPDILEFDPE